MDSIHPITTPLCPTCFLPYPSGENHPCSWCIQTPPPFHRAVAVFEYGGAVAQAIRRLKYGANLEAARPLGRLMAGHLAAMAPDVVAPMPLDRHRLAHRGFNQSMELARFACAEAGLRGPKVLLHRTTSRQPQASLTLAQRRRIPASTFAVSMPNAVAGRRILLIDDVITTTSTARAASRALVQAGASVEVLALARTPL